MPNNPPQPSPFGLHVADRALNPILSSSQSSTSGASNSQLRRQFQALSSLTTTAINSQDTASRLGLGTPQRIMVETHSSGPVVLTSYLHTDDQGRVTVQHSQENLRLLVETSDDGNAISAPANGIDSNVHEHTSDLGETENRNRSPLLIATVVAPSASEMGEARRAAARLEKAGRDFQRELASNQADDTGTTSGEDG